MLAAVLLALAGASAEPLVVFVADAHVVDDVDPALGPQVTRLVAARLAAFRGLEVHAGDELRALLDAEAQKQLAGCDEGDGACFAEVAQALDADLIVAIEIARLGQNVVVDIAVVDAAHATSGARERAQVRRSALDRLDVAVGEAADRAGAAVAPEHGPGPSLFIGVAGGAALVAGAGLLVGGLVPVAQHAGDGAAVDDATRRYVEGDDDALRLMGDARARQVEDAAAFDSWGRWLLVGGGVVVAAGAGAVVVAVAGPWE